MRRINHETHDNQKFRLQWVILIFKFQGYFTKVNIENFGDLSRGITKVVIKTGKK